MLLKDIKRDRKIKTATVALLSILFLGVFAALQPFGPSVSAEYKKKEGMPDLGQHSSQWCWVAAAANSFYWFKHSGKVPKFYPDEWDPPKIDPESTKESSKWYDKDCTADPKGYARLLREIVEASTLPEEKKKFCQRFFEEPWGEQQVNDYVKTLENFIKNRGLSDKLEVHTHKNPTFQNYMDELKRCQDVILFYQWGTREEIHLVTGVSYNTDKEPPEIEISDPSDAGYSIHNNDPKIDPENTPYVKHKVLKKEPLELEDKDDASENPKVPNMPVHYLFCVSPTENVTRVGGIAIPVNEFALLTPYIVLGVTIATLVVGSVYARKRWSGKTVVQRP